MSQISYKCECSVGKISILKELQNIWLKNILNTYEPRPCSKRKISIEKKLKATYYSFKARPILSLVIMLFIVFIMLKYSNIGLQPNVKNPEDFLYKNILGTPKINTDDFKWNNNNIYKNINYNLYQTEQIIPKAFNKNGEAKVIIDCYFDCSINKKGYIIDCKEL